MITDLMVEHTGLIWLPITSCEFTLFLYFAHGLGFRRKGTAVRVGQAALAFAGWLLVHYVHLDFVFDFALNILVLTAYIFLARVPRMQQALYSACIFVLCTEVGKILCVDFCMQPAYAYFSQLPAWAITVVWAALSQLIALATIAVLKRWVFTPGIERLTWKQSLFILLPLVPYVLVRTSGYMYDTSDFRLYLNMVLISISLSISTIVVIVANAHSLSAQLEKNELLMMQSLLKEQHAQYRAHKEATEAVRRQYHDLKHYVVELDAIQNEEPEERRRELGDFTARLKRELETYDSTIETGNEVLDVVLTEKRQHCLERGIRPVFYTDASALSFVNAFDLCAIFGNILDNAIEAVEQLPEGENRDIQLDVRRSKGMAVVRCRNPFAGELSTASGELATTKKSDVEHHGLGLKSTRRIAERYGGSLVWHAEDGAFEVTVMLPIRSEGAEEGGVADQTQR